MAYEKFIKKDGKLYGPYLYHSKRVDGKVVSEYHGQKKFDISKYSKLFLITAGVFLLGLFVYLFIFSSKNITGNAVLDMNANYQQGEPLSGSIKMSLQEGELIPSSSKVVVENNGVISEFNLKDLITDGTTNGNFYVNSAFVSGSGEGYGIPGEKEIFPEVSFTLSILSDSDALSESSTAGTTSSTETETTSTTETSTQEPTVTETTSTTETTAPTTETTTTETATETTTETSTGITESTPTPTAESSTTTPTETSPTESSTTTSNENPTEESPAQETSAPITGNVVAGIFAGISNFFLGLTPTGYSVAEFESEMSGKVSAGNVFTYTLSEGQRAEIKPRSVKAGSNLLDDGEVTLTTSGNTVTVATDYSEKESGFGQGYVGSREKDMVIDLSKLNLILTEGDLKVSIVSQGQELFSLTTFVKDEGMISAKEIVEQEPIIQDNSSNVPKETLPLNGTLVLPVAEVKLTSAEKAVLAKEFGNISVQVVEAKLKNGFIVVRYEFGNRWIENSYSSDLSNSTLSSFMEADKAKWLKDIAKSLSPETVFEQSIGWLEGNVSN